MKTRILTPRGLSGGVIVLAAALVLLWGGCGGGTGTTVSPSNLTSGLTQASPGSSPFINLAIHTSGLASDKTHGFLVYRGSTFGFPATPYYLIDLVPANPSTLFLYSDDASTRIITGAAVGYTYLDSQNGGSIATATCTASYTDPALVAGGSYYYRAVRLVEPLAPAGSNPPIAGQQTGNQVTCTPDNSILSQVSNAYGPITFYLPPVQYLPVDNASSQQSSNVSFTWQTTYGASQYIVQVYSQSDPYGQGLPYESSQIVYQTGGQASATVPGPFASGQHWYWRVGARQGMDVAFPLCMTTGRREWLYSLMRSFTSAGTPPPSP
jgi:hypothetical protein